jgi:hypothetical protein
VTAVPTTREGDLVGLSLTGGLAHFPGHATERTVALGALDPGRLEALLAAADAVAFFTYAEAGERPVRPDARTWVLRDRSRILTLSEPFADPRLATLIRLVRGCLFPARAVGNETPQIGADAGTVERMPAARSASILDALDTPRAGDIEIGFDRPISHPRPVIFD